MSEEHSERLLTDFSIGYAPILDAVPARESESSKRKGNVRSVMYVLFEWLACASGQGTPVFFARSRQTWRFPSKQFYNRYIGAEDLQAKNRVVTYLGSSCGAEGLGLV